MRFIKGLIFLSILFVISCLPDIKDEDLILINSELRESNKDRIYLVFNKALNESLPMAPSGFAVLDNGIEVGIINLENNVLSNSLVLILQKNLNITNKITVSYNGLERVTAADGAVLDEFNNVEVVYVLDDRFKSDKTDPVPGNSGLVSFFDVTRTQIGISWNRGSDYISSSSNLQYKVVYSMMNNIDTVENAENNGTLVSDWAEDYNSVHLYGLSANTTYYFNVLVKDQNNNKAVYTVNSRKTPDYWNSLGNLDYIITNEIHNMELKVNNGVPYLAYMEKLPASSYAYVKVVKYNGSNWVVLGIVGSSWASSSVYEVSLDFNNGIPYVAYYDNEHTLSGVSLKRLNGTNWEYVGDSGFSDFGCYYNSLFIYNGTPYIAFRDYNYSNKLTVMYYSGFGWEVLGSRGFSSGEVRKIKLVFSSGTAYVSYTDKAFSDNIVIKKFNGISWIDVGTPIYTRYNHDFVIDNGKLYISTIVSNQFIKLYKNSGAAWEEVSLGSFSGEQTVEISLKVDNGVPYILYQGSGWVPILIKFTGADWEYVGSQSISEDGSSLLNLDIYNGYPYVAYVGTYNTKITVKKFE